MKSNIWPPVPSRPQDMGAEVVRIERLAAGGRGVGRVRGKVWLVLGGLPGDRVRARIERDRPRFVEARVEEVIESGPDRRPAACPVQGECGGCPWMPLDEAAQRRAKREIVVDSLSRIGRFRTPPVEPLAFAGDPLGYRNRVEFALARAESGARILGLHRAGSDRVVDVSRCLLQDEEAHAILGTIRAFLLRGAGAVDPAWDDPRLEARIAIRRAPELGRSLVVVRTAGPPPPSIEGLSAVLAAEHATLGGVVHLAGRPGRRGSARTTVFGGEDRIPERIGETTFRVPAGTFLQVNPDGASLLHARVIEEIGGAASLLDLYAGVGAVGIALARRGVRVLAVEADGEAVAAGREAAAEIPGISFRFVVDRVEHAVVREETIAFAPEVVHADPPRAGIGIAGTRALAALGARRVVLVACDPAALARDARTLVESGYRLTRVLPIDLFPQTAHVEAVASFDRDD